MAGKAAAKRRAKAAARKQAARSSGGRPAAAPAAVEEEEPATPESGAAGPPEGLLAGEKDIPAQLAYLFKQTGVSWQHDPRSCGYYYSAELQYYFNGATGMYWGGDPPAWSKAPPRRAVDILRLTDLGFRAEHAAMALRACDGHVERAANWLLGHADPVAEKRAAKKTGQQWHEIRQWQVVNGRTVPAVEPRAAGPSPTAWPTPGPTSSASIGGVDHTKGSYARALRQSRPAQATASGGRALHARKPDAPQRPRPAPNMPVPRARASRRGVIRPSADDVEIQSSADVGEKDEAVRDHTLKAAERMARTDASTAADVRPWGDDDSGADSSDEKRKSGDEDFKLVRSTNHLVFKRVRKSDGFTQTWIRSQTPSDKTTWKHEAAQRKRLDLEWEATLSAAGPLSK